MNILIIGHVEHVQILAECSRNLEDKTIIMVKDDPKEPISLKYELQPVRLSCYTKPIRRSDVQPWKKAWKK